jgi:hypothetical protein
MGAELGNSSFLDHGHPVGVVRGVEAMCDGDHSTALQHGVEGALQVAGGARVEQGGRLV